jgi:hypothetical protein
MKKYLTQLVSFSLICSFLVCGNAQAFWIFHSKCCNPTPKCCDVAPKKPNKVVKKEVVETRDYSTVQEEAPAIKEEASIPQDKGIETNEVKAEEQAPTVFYPGLW